ncbi:MAG: hypothetical protein WB988_22595, partial [Candidatus Nitrosopolaris sp.]
VQARLSFCTYFLLYPLVITLQDWSVNHVRNLKCQPCMEAAQLLIAVFSGAVAPQKPLLGPFEIYLWNRA